MHDHIERVLFSEQEIVSGIDRIAKDLTALYGDEELTVVSVLKGSCVFVSDLIRRLPVPLQLAFVWAESYRSGTTPGKLEIRLLPHEEEIRGRHLLLVDDILDSGQTMAAIKREMLERGAKDVKTCVFLDKPERRKTKIHPDFRCFEVEDFFVVGYGLDYDGRYRNLPYVGALKPEVFGSPVTAGEGGQ